MVAKWLWVCQPWVIYPCGNAATDQLQRDILLDTKGQYTKESNTLAGNMIIKQAQMEILPDTNWQYMKEWNTLGVMQSPSNSKGHFTWHNRSVDEWVKYPCRQCDHQTSLKENIARHKKNSTWRSQISLQAMQPPTNLKCILFQQDISWRSWVSMQAMWLSSNFTGKSCWTHESNTLQAIWQSSKLKWKSC